MEYITLIVTLIEMCQKRREERTDDPKEIRAMIRNPGPLALRALAREESKRTGKRVKLRDVRKRARNMTDDECDECLSAWQTQNGG